MESGTTISINLSFPHCEQLLGWTEVFSCPFLKTTIHLLLRWAVHSTTATFVYRTNCFGICCKKGDLVRPFVAQESLKAKLDWPDLVALSAKRPRDQTGNIHLSNDDSFALSLSFPSNCLCYFVCLCLCGPQSGDIHLPNDNN